MSNPTDGPTYEDGEYMLKIMKALPEDDGTHIFYVYSEWVRSAAYAKGLLEWHDFMKGIKDE